jgi:hypothetical protein
MKYTSFKKSRRKSDRDINMDPYFGRRERWMEMRKTDRYTDRQTEKREWEREKIAREKENRGERE